jgi:electron transfer flavoprotein beta subunit
MTNIVVLIKQVPDSGSERQLSDDFSLDRSIDPVIDEINEKAVEAALQIKEANGGEVTVLTRALGTVEGVELVIAGNEATDGRVGAVPAMIAEYLELPHLTSLRSLKVEGETVTGERETDEGIFTLEGELPAIVSVNEKINEARFPSFKGIMAAKKKEIAVVSLAEIDVEGDDVGATNAGSEVLSATPKPPKQAGERVADEGDGGTKVVEFLVSQKII